MFTKVSLATIYHHTKYREILTIFPILYISYPGLIYLATVFVLLKFPHLFPPLPFPLPIVNHSFVICLYDSFLLKVNCPIGLLRLLFPLPGNFQQPHGFLSLWAPEFYLLQNTLSVLSESVLIEFKTPNKFFSYLQPLALLFGWHHHGNIADT